jgi:hypothetical protein
LKRWLSVGVAACVLLAGCGGSSDKSSSSGATAPATPTTGIASRVLTGNELSRFKTSQPSVSNTVSRWVTSRQTPTQDVAAETKRLTRLGFVAGASEDLSGSSGPGLSTAEQFKTAGGARSELANEVKVFKGQAEGPKTFAVAGIPGAVGLAATGAGGVNVAFTSGDYYYLVGAFVTKVNASAEAAIGAAARHLYTRVHD